MTTSTAPPSSSCRGAPDHHRMKLAAEAIAAVAGGDLDTDYIVRSLLDPRVAPAASAAAAARLRGGHRAVNRAGP